jgi:hypothetical protein
MSATASGGYCACAMEAVAKNNAMINNRTHKNRLIELSFLYLTPVFITSASVRTSATMANILQ